MKKFYLNLILVAFTSLFFVNCEKDDDEVADEIVDPFIAEGLEGGASAKEILTEVKYTSLTMEFAYVAGHRPSQLALDNLRAFMEARIHKSGGITFVETVIPAPTGTMNFDKIKDLEVEHRTKFRTESDIALWCLMVNDPIFNEDGTPDNGTLGAVYFNTSMYLSINSLQILADDGPLEYDAYESSTLNHEFSHFLGLVNTVNDDIHAPGEHEGPAPDGLGHCKIESCLMYWSTGSGSPRYLGSPEMIRRGIMGDELDPLCLADLVAKGGK